MNDQELYVRLGRLMETAPDFGGGFALSPDDISWMAKAYALLNAGQMFNEAGKVTTMMDAIINTADSPEYRRDYGSRLMASMQRAFAVAELKAPAEVAGAFINAGNAFDALAAVGKVFTSASASIRIVDPYMDEKVLTDFALMAEPGVKIELLADEVAVKKSLSPAVTRWAQQYKGERPLEARLAGARVLHDRLIIVDRKTVWTLTQSLNAFAVRSPASIVRVDAESATLKVAAYEKFWEASTVIA